MNPRRVLAIVFVVALPTIIPFAGVFVLTSLVVISLSSLSVGMWGVLRKFPQFRIGSIAVPDGIEPFSLCPPDKTPLSPSYIRWYYEEYPQEFKKKASMNNYLE